MHANRRQFILAVTYVALSQRIRTRFYQDDFNISKSMFCTYFSWKHLTVKIIWVPENGEGKQHKYTITFQITDWISARKILDPTTKKHVSLDVLMRLILNGRWKTNHSHNVTKLRKKIYFQLNTIMHYWLIFQKWVSSWETKRNKRPMLYTVM